MIERKMIILSGPSGAGKTTVARHLIKQFNNLKFTVSATTRKQRPHEEDGVDYHFISPSEFAERLHNGDFIEFQEVYKGNYYGTLKNELEKIWEEGNVPLLDIDVKGAVNLMENYGGCGLFVFIHPGDLQNLKKRLIDRGTEDDSSLQKRLNRANEELTYSLKFDVTLVNDVLERAFDKATSAVKEFLE